MTLQEQILEDFKKERKASKVKRDCLRYIIGEFQREKNKKLSNDEATIILKKLKGRVEEEIVLGNNSDSELYLRIIESYIPKQVSEEEIKCWIINNIDFSKYKNKLEAMKEIMLHFGVTVNGKDVRNILMSIGD